MDNKEFGKKLEIRTKQFAISIIRLSVSLPGSPEGKVIRNQLTKSGTSLEQIPGKLNQQFIKIIIFC
jgi:hypothetical protein